MLRLESIPARQGDALWIEWGDPVSRMIIDMGTEQIGRNIRSRIQDLPEDQRVFELLIVTHVDQDHIGGILTCLAEADPIPGLIIKDVWFNGWDHLHGRSIAPDPNGGGGLEPFGPAHGERLTTWLREQTWNDAFGGKPAIRPEDDVGPTVDFDGDLKLTILGPRQSDLEAFIDEWADAVHEALEKGSLDHVSPGLEEFGPAGRPPEIETQQDLEELALVDTRLDPSRANGSSISVLLEHDDKRVVLAGDAHSPDLVDALQKITDVGPVEVDLVKLPHHASEKNVTIDLIEKLDCPRWLISTDGTRFKHPDPVAVARIINFSRADTPELIFNVQSEFNEWWNRDDWRDAFGYRTRYGTPSRGVVVEL